MTASHAFFREQGRLGGLKSSSQRWQSLVFPDLISTAAGIEKADLVVAVSSSDEANLVASLIAKQAGVERTIVRIEAAELRGPAGEELREAIGADLVIDPDEETAHEVLELLEYPGASEIAVMGGGEVVVIGARLHEEAPLVGRTLHEIAEEYEPDWEFLVGAITRDDETIIPRGDQRLPTGCGRILLGQKQLCGLWPPNC